MVKQIITPLDTLVTFELPKEMVGKRVAVLAYEVEEERMAGEESKEVFLKRIEDLTAASMVDLSGFKFDRDEANNYDE